MQTFRSSMKHLAAVAAFIGVAGTASPAAGQNIQGLPRVSPRAVVTQQVGLTEITIDYHRPAVNDREVWGQLVPYDTVWRAGANDNTTITFSDPVKIEGESLAAGTYGLHALPSEDSWTWIFSHDSTSWGSFSYDEAEDALRVEVKAEKAPFTERLSYAFDVEDHSNATAELRWEELRVPFSIEVDSLQRALVKIRQDLRHLPGFNWQGWNSAANYCLRNDFNHEEALEWVDRSISMSETSANLLTKSGLLQQLDRGEEATAMEARAIDIATEAQLNGLGYRYLLQQSDPKRAIEIFAENVRRHPDSWNAYDSLGEAYGSDGDTKKAIENYRKALEKAPENQQARIRSVIEGFASP